MVREMAKIVPSLAQGASNMSHTTHYLATNLGNRFASLDQAFALAQNQGDILNPDCYLAPANSSAEAAAQLAAKPHSFIDRLPVITSQYSAAIRAAIAQGQQDGLIQLTYETV